MVSRLTLHHSGLIRPAAILEMEASEYTHMPGLLSPLFHHRGPIKPPPCERTRERAANALPTCLLFSMAPPAITVSIKDQLALETTSRRMPPCQLSIPLPLISLYHLTDCMLFGTGSHVTLWENKKRKGRWRQPSMSQIHELSNPCPFFCIPSYFYYFNWQKCLALLKENIS